MSRDFVPINENQIYLNLTYAYLNLIRYHVFLSYTFPIDHLLIACYRDIKLIIQDYLLIKHINYYHNARTKIQSLYTKFI